MAQTFENVMGTLIRPMTCSQKGILKCSDVYVTAWTTSQYNIIIYDTSQTNEFCLRTSYVSLEDVPFNS